MSLVATTRTASSLAVTGNRYENKRSHWFQLKEAQSLAIMHWNSGVIGQSNNDDVRVHVIGWEHIWGFIGAKYQNRCLTLYDWLIDSSWRHDFLKQKLITNQKQHLRLDTPGVHQLSVSWSQWEKVVVVCVAWWFVVLMYCEGTFFNFGFCFGVFWGAVCWFWIGF